MNVIHVLLAWGVVAAALVGGAWSTLMTVTMRAESPALVRFQAAVTALLVVAAVSGILLLATGARPTDGLHLLYAAVAVAVIPLSRSFLPDGTTGRRAGLIMLIAFAVLGGLSYRLFTTG